MAMINCPECGRTVSDKADSCPQCGFPISSLRTDGVVKMKILNGLAGMVTVFETTTLRSLWQGRAGDVAEFTVDKPTEIRINWGVNQNKRKVMEDYTVTVKAGEKYEMARVQGFFFESIVIRKVDVIDSDR